MRIQSDVSGGQAEGGIQGTVRDQQGEPLPGVVVEASSPSLLGERMTVTRANGEFLFRELPPGEYTLTATMPGMKTVKIKVGVTIGRVTPANITMQAQSVEE